jgi:type IV secretory pathway VirB10-like protein
VTPNAWKFSLLGVFVLLISGQMGFYLLKLRNCNNPNIPSSPVCDELLKGYQQATDAHLQTILALMVGTGAIAAGSAAISSGTHQKPQEPEDIPEEPGIPAPPPPPPEDKKPPGPMGRRKPPIDGDDQGRG